MIHSWYLDTSVYTPGENLFSQYLAPHDTIPQRKGSLLKLLHVSGPPESPSQASLTFPGANHVIRDEKAARLIPAVTIRTVFEAN